VSFTINEEYADLVLKFLSETKLFALSESKAPLSESKATLSEIKEEPAKPVEQVATASPAVEPAPVKKKRNMKGLIKYANERKKRLEERENKGMESEPKVPRPQLVRQPTPEQFLQQNLDEFVEAGKEKEKEEKEREIKEQPNEERLLAESRVREPEYSSPLTARILNNLGSLTFSALLSLVGNYAVRTNNKDLNIYAMTLSAALGEALFRPISQAGAGLDTILNNIKKLGATPQDIIKESKQEGKQARRPDIRPEDDEPPAPSGRPSEPPPQRSVEDIKGERPLPPKPRVRMSDREMKDMIDKSLSEKKRIELEKKRIDSMVDERSIPRVAADMAVDIGSGIMSGVGALGGALSRGATSSISSIANQLYEAVTFDNADYGENVPDYILPRSMEGKFPIRKGATVQYSDLGQPVIIIPGATGFSATWTPGSSLTKANSGTQTFTQTIHNIGDKNISIVSTLIQNGVVLGTSSWTGTTNHTFSYTSNWVDLNIGIAQSISSYRVFP
jgi:hypothetical protein